jgi:porin
MKKTCALIPYLWFAFATAWAGDGAAGTTGTTGTTGNLLTELGQMGVTFPVSYTGEVLGNPAGGRRQGAIYDGLLEAGVQVDLSQLAHWQGATFTADGFYPHGSSLTRNDVHDLNVLSNIDAFHDPRLYELWLQQVLLDGKLSIRVGQIPADTEFGLTAYGSLLLNSAFGTQPTIGLNMEAPIYPAAAPGVRVIYKPSDGWVLMAAVFDGSTGSLEGADKNGTDFNFDPRNGTLCMAEADYTANPPPAAPADGKAAAPASRPLSGTYKVGGFLNTEDFTDIKTGGTLHGDYGVYAIADQELWHEPGAPDKGLRGFCRLGFVPPDRNTVAFDLETGLNYAGLLRGRDKDLTGLGFAYTKVSDGALNDDGNAPGRHYESIVEWTYQAPVNDHLTVQPDVQYIINPGGGDERLRNALVLGLRFTMQF